MRLGLIVIKYFAFMPILLFFDILYFRRHEKMFLYMMLISVLYIALMAIFDYLLYKGFFKEGFDRNFNQIEINELTKESNKNKDEILTLTDRVIKFSAESESRKNECNALKELYKEITDGYIETIILFAGLLEAKGKFERGHCRRVMELSCEIGKRLDLSDRELEILRYSSVLHDIGKLEFDEELVNKSEELNTDEMKQIKQHPIVAYNLLIGIDFLKSCATVILQHHERFDGTGYPYRLVGDKINKLARVISVSDAFEAMISDRPYKKGLEIVDALHEIEKNKGTQFDPQISNILVEMIRESKGIMEAEENNVNEKESDKDN